MCTCRCECENGRTNGEREQRKRLVQFLMGLDDSYTNVRGQILLMQPLPLVSKAYSMLRQEEKQRDTPKASQMPIPTALNTYSNRNNQQTTRSNNKTATNGQTSSFRKAPYIKGILCTNCGKEGWLRDSWQFTWRTLYLDIYTNNNFYTINYCFHPSQLKQLVACKIGSSFISNSKENQVNFTTFSM